MDDNVMLNVIDFLGCLILYLFILKVICQLLVYIVILIIFIFGNSILIGVIINYFCVQIVMNYYIINMVVVDLLMIVFDMVVQIWYYGLMIVYKLFEWFDGSMGVFFCKFVVFI